MAMLRNYGESLDFEIVPVLVFSILVILLFGILVVLVFLCFGQRTFSLFSVERLHERIARIVGNASAYYPTTKLPSSFPRRGSGSGSGGVGGGGGVSRDRWVKWQDRSIKIVRSKESLFWSLFWYFEVLGLPTPFLFGGVHEFDAVQVVPRSVDLSKHSGQSISSEGERGRYLVAALPHHCWCLVEREWLGAAGGGAGSAGLERYYAADCRLKAVHSTLWASLCPMVRDRLYDALILVLQQRGVVEEEALSGGGCSGQSASLKRRMDAMVCDEPLYRLLGKLQSGFGADSALVFAKSFNKSCDRLSYVHKSRLILPQDKGISNLFASKVQELLLLVHDSYHRDRDHRDAPKDGAADARRQDANYDVDPAAFHLILRNLTYCQLLRRHDRAQRQIKALLNAPKTRPLSTSSASSSPSSSSSAPSIEHTDGLGIVEAPSSSKDTRSSLQIESANHDVVPLHRHDGNRQRRASAPLHDPRSVAASHSVSAPHRQRDAVSAANCSWNWPSARLLKVGVDSLSPLKRRRHSVDHPVYVPRLRAVLDDEFWLSQYRWYIYYFQPRRIKYVYFILLIQQFYAFRRHKVEAMPLPPAFAVHFGQRTDSDTATATATATPQPEWRRLLQFELDDMNPQSQPPLGRLQYAQFIYYHFVHSAAKFKIQFSDKDIVRHIEHCLFAQKEPPHFRHHVALNVFDKMFNAVFRYLHQMTYEPFVIWMNTK